MLVFGGLNAYDKNLNVIRVLSIISKEVRWTTSTDFNKGTNFNTAVTGTGESSYVGLASLDNNSDNVPFTDPADYTYDSAKIEVTGGVAKLKLASGAATNWTFTESGDYIYDANKIEVIESLAKFKKTVAESPCAWWHLNETSGTTASDSSENGNTGTLVNGPTWVAGKLNNALSFDGTNDAWLGTYFVQYNATYDDSANVIGNETFQVIPRKFYSKVGGGYVSRISGVSVWTKTEKDEIIKTINSILNIIQNSDLKQEESIKEYLGSISKLIEKPTKINKENLKLINDRINILNNTFNEKDNEVKKLLNEIAQLVVIQIPTEKIEEMIK